MLNLDSTDLFLISEKTEQLNILLEKRKRNHLYNKLDYILSSLTYFDFFSNDTFKLITHTKNLSSIYSKKNISSEFLLYSFCDKRFNISTLLSEYKLNQISIAEFFPIFSEKKIKYLKDEKIELKYSHELNLIFEKASENAITRFKTPIITPQILFVTILEETDLKITKIIKKILNNSTNWYLLRYKLIKEIHAQELAIRNDVKKNEHYFAYLLKNQLSDFEFNRLIELNSLDLGVSIFRNLLIMKLLKFNFSSFLYNDIYKSIKATNNRQYHTNI